MFIRQKDRFLPMPDYSIGVDDGVLLRIPGNVIDIEYSVRLIQDTSIDLTTAVVLDRVQKHLPISNDAFKKLRKEHLIEGRKPYLTISKALAQSTGREADYSKNKPFSDTFCCDLIMEYLSKEQEEQTKVFKVGNLLSKLKRKVNLLVCYSSSPSPASFLSKRGCSARQWESWRYGSYSQPNGGRKRARGRRGRSS